MIKIKNLREQKPTQDWDIQVDRSSPLGNPFTMQQLTQADRNKVCDEYAEYFAVKLQQKDTTFMTELNRLIGIYKKFGMLNLFCWCAPQKCHAETIADYITRVCHSTARIPTKKIS